MAEGHHFLQECSQATLEPFHTAVIQELFFMLPTQVKFVR